MSADEKKTTPSKTPQQTPRSYDLISAYVDETGKVEIAQTKDEASDSEIFKKQMKSLTELVQNLDNIAERVESEDQILQASHEFKTNPEEALKQLSDSTIRIVTKLRKQDSDRAKQKRKRLERMIVLILAVIMIGIVGTLAFYMDANTEIAVIGLPLPVVLWSFIGGVGATLYAFVGSQQEMETVSLRLDWLIGRPIVGVIMGSVVYLAIVATSTTIIGGDVQTNASATASKPYLLWALSFIGGFSDKFAILLFDNLVGKYTTGAQEEKQSVEQATGGNAGAVNTNGTN